MQDLLQIVENENIHLVYRDFTRAPRLLLGLYFINPRSGKCYIALENELEHNLPLHRSVLAEELGHHFTVPQADFIAPYTSFTLKMALSRDEAKAIRWACNFLMPDHQFWPAIESGLLSVEELADHFNVTTWLILKKLQFLIRESPGMEFYLRTKKKIAASYYSY